MIKFIYKNFIIPLKSIKRKQISEAKENIDEMQPEKPVEVSPLEFIISDKRSEGIDIEFIKQNLVGLENTLQFIALPRKIHISNERLLECIIFRWRKKIENEAFAMLSIIHKERKSQIISEANKSKENNGTDFYTKRFNKII